MRYGLLLFSALCLTSCFAPQTKSVHSQENKKSLITAADFAGASGATNVVTGIKISWPASNVTPTAYRVYAVSGETMNLLASLGPQTTSYIDGQVEWGRIYSYIVRAVDGKNVEDANTSRVSSLAWGSFDSVAATSRTSLTVTFRTPVPAAEEIRIYVQGDPSESPRIETVTGSALSATITGLRPGFKYKVRAQAFVSSLKKEDGNTLTREIATLTNGYDTDPTTGASPAWMNVTNVRAFGPAPGAVEYAADNNKNPSNPMVELSFKSFNGFGAGTKYVVTRTTEDKPMDTSVAATCTPGTLESCRVICFPDSGVTELSGAGVLHCRDKQVGESPLRYRYTMSLLRSEGSLSWVEPLAEENSERYSILVPMPPKYMVLVQRNAVNYEMCAQQMNLPPDPNNFNRCPYKGLGAVPYNSGPGKTPLNLNPDYYDFGYNLFVDRYEYGCKWTRAVDGGRCGTGASAGDCVIASNSAPDDSIGKNGDILLRLRSGISTNSTAASDNFCYYKHEGKWIISNNVPSRVPNGAAVLAGMYTNDITANGGLISTSVESLTPYTTWGICQGHVDPNYGPKRLSRMREYRAFSTFPTVPEDLYYITYARANSLSRGNAVWGAANGYRCPVNISTTAYPPMASITSLSSMLAGTSEYFGYYDSANTTYYGASSFRLNASATLDCQGRYGLANVHNLAATQWGSDNFNINSDSKLLTGAASMLDSGNFDVLSDIANPTSLTGYVLNYAAAPINSDARSYYTYNTGTSPYIAVPLGLPIISPSATGYTAYTSFIEHYSDQMLIPANAGVITPRSARLRGRWGLFANNTALTGTDWTVIRCVVPAD